MHPRQLSFPVHLGENPIAQLEVGDALLLPLLALGGFLLGRRPHLDAPVLGKEKDKEAE